MRWSVVLPVFNEAGFLPRTLASLGAQSLPFRLVLVDNGSTDGCIAAARAQIIAAGITADIIEEAQPGQVHALRHGLDRVSTELVAICDADTWYPPHYLATAADLFDRRGANCVACCAWLAPAQAGRLRRLARAVHRLSAARLIARQNHTSGAAQTFRVAALRRAGGYDPVHWRYVLKDHELMNRVLQHGRQAYARALWCITSDRRSDRRQVRWTLAERLRYHITPFARQQAFFHDWLAPRFAARGQADTVLREQNWAQSGATT